MTSALLIFARRPSPGRVKSRLSPFLSPQEAAALYDCMLRDVIARSAGLEIASRFLFYEDDEEAQGYFREIDDELLLLPQEGAGLGERLSNAFDEAFRRGFRKVAVIGTDSPDLPVTFIREAFLQLESGEAELLFGPTEDGGYYLAAMAAPHPELFREMPWSTDRLLAASLQRAAKLGLRSALLPQWYDLDEPADLERPGLLEEKGGALLTRQYLTKRLMN